MDDKTYITEMDKRFAELASGRVKSYTLEEMKAGTRESYKTGNEETMSYT